MSKIKKYYVEFANEGYRTTGTPPLQVGSVEARTHEEANRLARAMVGDLDFEECGFSRGEYCTIILTRKVGDREIRLERDYYIPKGIKYFTKGERKPRSPKFPDPTREGYTATDGELYLLTYNGHGSGYSIFRNLEQEHGDIWHGIGNVLPKSCTNHDLCMAIEYFITPRGE